VNGLKSEAVAKDISKAEVKATPVEVNNLLKITASIAKPIGL